MCLLFINQQPKYWEITQLQITLEEEEEATSLLGRDSSALNPSELPFPTANPESYRNSNLSCLLKNKVIKNELTHALSKTLQHHKS